SGRARRFAWIAARTAPASCCACYRRRRDTAPRRDRTPRRDQTTGRSSVERGVDRQATDTAQPGAVSAGRTAAGMAGLGTSATARATSPVAGGATAAAFATGTAASARACRAVDVRRNEVTVAA